jgi:hypothetical protein
MRQSLFCAAVLSLMLVAAESRAAIVNGDFETGDLSGWTVDLAADNGPSDVPGTATVETVDGSLRAVLTAASDVFVDLESGQPQSYSLAKISQIVTLADAATVAVDISGSYSAIPAAFSPGGIATIGITLTNTANQSSHTLLHIGSFYSGFVTLHSFDTLAVAAVLPAGEYRLEAFAIANNEGNLESGGSVEASLTLDNFRLLPVPEPSGLLLISLAALCLIAKARR